MIRSRAARTILVAIRTQRRLDILGWTLFRLRLRYQPEGLMRLAMLVYLPVLDRHTATRPRHEKASTSRAEDGVSDVKTGNCDNNGEDAEGNYEGGVGGIVRIGHDADGLNGIADLKYILMQ